MVLTVEQKYNRYEKLYAANYEPFSLTVKLEKNGISEPGSNSDTTFSPSS